MLRVIRAESGQFINGSLPALCLQKCIRCVVTALDRNVRPRKRRLHTLKMRHSGINPALTRRFLPLVVDAAG